MRNLDERDDWAGQLAAALQCSAPAGAGSACPDAADLAAWLDAPSGSSERRSLDEHVACCPRCQQVTAAFAKTTPPGPEVVPSPVAAGRPVRRRIGLWAWLLPAAATTAAALAWFVVRPLVVAPAQAPVLQYAETTQAAAADAKDTVAAGTVGAAKVDQTQRSREETTVSSRVLAEAPAAVAPDTERRDARKPVGQTARKAEIETAPPRPAQAALPPAAVHAAPTPPAGHGTRSSRRQQQPPPTVPAEARVAEREVPPPMRAEELKVAGQAAAPTTVARTTGLAAAADTIGADEAAEFTVISASDQTVRWRVRRGSLLRAQ